MWWNKRRKLKNERLRQFRPGDNITYMIGGSSTTNKVLNNDQETETLSIKVTYYSGSETKVYNYSDSRFDNIRALNPDPQDDTDLKTFLNDIINNVGNPITDLQKNQAKDLIKSYKL